MSTSIHNREWSYQLTEAEKDLIEAKRKGETTATERELAFTRISLEGAQADLREANKQVAQLLYQRTTSGKELAEAKEQLAEDRKQIGDLLKQRNDVGTALDMRPQDCLSNLVDDAHTVQQAKKDLAKELDEANAEIERLKKELDSDDVELATAASEITRLHEARNQAIKELTEANRQIAGLQNKVNRDAEQINSLMGQVTAATYNTPETTDLYRYTAKDDVDGLLVSKWCTTPETAEELWENGSHGWTAAEAELEETLVLIMDNCVYLHDGMTEEDIVDGEELKELEAAREKVSQLQRRLGI